MLVWVLCLVAVTGQVTGQCDPSPCGVNTQSMLTQAALQSVGVYLDTTMLRDPTQ